MVPGVGVEPTQCYHRGILSPVRLPVPPSRHFIFQTSVDRLRKKKLHVKLLEQMQIKYCFEKNISRRINYYFLNEPKGSRMTLHMKHALLLTSLNCLFWASASSSDALSMVAVPYDAFATDIQSAPDIKKICSAAKERLCNEGKYLQLLSFLPTAPFLISEGNEFAKSIPGSGNVVSKLAEKHAFGQAETQFLLDCAVRPTVTPHAAALIQCLKNTRVIAFGNQDPLQNERYLKKLSEEKKLDLQNTITNHVIVAGLLKLKNNDSRPYYEHTEPWQTVMAYRPYPNLAFAKALLATAKNISPQSSLTVFDTNQEAVERINGFSKVPQYELEQLHAIHCASMQDMSRVISEYLAKGPAKN